MNQPQGMHPGQPNQFGNQQPQQPQQPGMQQPGVQQPGMQPQQPQMAPQQGFQQPGQPGVPQQQAQPQPQMGAPQQQQPQGPPPIHIPDAQAQQQLYQTHKQQMTGGGMNFLSFPGPQGQTRWGPEVPIGFESVVHVYLCPSWAENQYIFYPTHTHFWKDQSHPQGASIGCSGPETCLVCQAREAAMNTADGTLKQRAKDFGKVKKSFLYNCFNLDNPQAHFDEFGVMRPFILRAGSNLHDAIGNLIEGRQGPFNIVHPDNGRPLMLKKIKKGKREMDVDYSALDMDPQPLDQYYRAGLYNLWDLSRLDKLPTQEEMVAAVMGMGLPMPGTMQSGQTAPQQGFGQPANPYPLQQPGQPQVSVGAMNAPTHVPPPVAGPAQPQQPMAQPQQPQQPMAPQQPAPQPFQQPQAPLSQQAPPNLSPPPISSGGQQMAGVAQQPAVQQPVQQPQQPAPQPQQPQVAQQPMQQPGAPQQPVQQPEGGKTLEQLTAEMQGNTQ